MIYEVAKFIGYPKKVLAIKNVHRKQNYGIYIGGLMFK